MNPFVRYLVFDFENFLMKNLFSGQLGRQSFECSFLGLQDVMLGLQLFLDLDDLSVQAVGQIK